MKGGNPTSRKDFGNYWPTVTGIALLPAWPPNRSCTTCMACVRPESGLDCLRSLSLSRSDLVAGFRSLKDLHPSLARPSVVTSQNSKERVSTVTSQNKKDLHP